MSKGRQERLENNKSTHKHEGIALLKSSDHAVIPQTSLGNKINIVIRLRPFLEEESTQGCVKLLNKTGEMILKKDFYQIHFKFDNLLNQTDDQNELYTSISYITTYFLVGLNGTIFAYGQTGAGKTYSIIGQSCDIRNERKGILPRAISHIFQSKCDQYNRKIMISFYEIYNEKIFDLLPNDDKTKEKLIKNTRAKKSDLPIKEEADGSFSVENLQRYEVHTEEEALEFFDCGILNRKRSSLNNKSSRSHAIIEIYMEKESKRDKNQKIRSKLRIVDLAGSEKYSAKLISAYSKDKNEIGYSKLNESTFINGSLSALGQCISALADQKRTHIPFRNSKLTKVLKDSLEINSKIALIVCISPSIDSYKETVSTLQFADRAKKAVLQAQNDTKKGRQRASSQSKFNYEEFKFSEKEAYLKIKMLMKENEDLK